MGKFTDWIKEHVRPYAVIRDDEGDFGSLKPEDANNSISDNIKEDIKKTEVGIKITWKW